MFGGPVRTLGVNCGSGGRCHFSNGFFNRVSVVGKLGFHSDLTCGCCVGSIAAFGPGGGVECSTRKGTLAAINAGGLASCRCLRAACVGRGVLACSFSMKGRSFGLLTNRSVRTAH